MANSYCESSDMIVVSPGQKAVFSVLPTFSVNAILDKCLPFSIREIIFSKTAIAFDRLNRSADLNFKVIPSSVLPRLKLVILFEIWLGPNCEVKDKLSNVINLGRKQVVSTFLHWKVSTWNFECTSNGGQWNMIWLEIILSGKMEIS